MVKKTKSTLYYDKIAESYEEELKEPFWQLYYAVTWNHLQRYLPKNQEAKILDAGGGTGYWSRKLAMVGYDVICCDISKEMLKVGFKLAKEQGLEKKITFKYGDILDIDFIDDESFEMVIAQGDPVGYCGDPSKAIMELSRVAKKGAVISISVDSFYMWLGKLIASRSFEVVNKFIENQITKMEFPQYNFKVSELKLMYKESGLKVLAVIGKPVLTSFLPVDQWNDLLADKNFFDKLYELEIKYNSEPSIIGLSGHIQITGIKI